MINGFFRQALDDALDGALVLTVNRRLSRHLRSLYDDEMVRQGRCAWSAPAITSLDRWLNDVVAAGGDDWRLLGGFAAQRLWETVIEETPAGTAPDLLQVPATARRAVDAHRMLHEYLETLPREHLTDDQEMFLRWREAFLDRCRKSDWLDPGSLIAWVTEKAAAGAMELPPKVLLAGFDEISPALRRLCRTLEEAGVAVAEARSPVAPVGRIERIGCADTADEVRCAARWARRLLEKGEQKIGIVAPRLGECRDLIERIFREEIDPASLLPDSGEEEAFGLSLGVRLVEQGPVVAALALLGLDEEIPLDQASLLLRSPYLKGSLDEASVRGLLEARLRTFGCERVRLSRLATLARKNNRAPRFSRICETLIQYCNDTRKRTPGGWVEVFTALLTSVGWPGQRVPDSREYQVLNAWREKLLPALVALDRISPPLAQGEAVALLRRLAAETEFQPETPDSPIHVVGHLEAAGLCFDHLWVLGLSEEAFPSPAAPNPFLPVRLQSACGMPHADGERERKFARTIADRLFAAAPRVVLSWPHRRGDCDLRPSALIRSFPEIIPELAASSSPVAVVARNAPVLQSLTDDTGPPLPADTRAAGGTAILKDQALCPFRAFVHHRLSGKALEIPQAGIDARTRGSLLHAALEAFWARTQSQECLLILDEAALKERVRTCATGSLEAAVEKGTVTVPGTVIDIERERLTAVILEWLEVEKERPGFRVLETEQEHLLRFGGLTIKTKVDRIDRLEGGELAVLDYKTGRIDVEDLLGDRLIEPQLPVYGVGEKGRELGGVGFGIVRRGECALKGICRDEGTFPKIEAFAGSGKALKYDIDGWSGLLARWRRQIEDLGEEFVRGRASVMPVDTAKACRFCDLPSLCRIDEIQLQQEESP